MDLKQNINAVQRHEYVDVGGGSICRVRTPTLTAPLFDEILAVLICHQRWLQQLRGRRDGGGIKAQSRWWDGAHLPLPWSSGLQVFPSVGLTGSSHIGNCLLAAQSPEAPVEEDPLSRAKPSRPWDSG